MCGCGWGRGRARGAYGEVCFAVDGLASRIRASRPHSITTSHPQQCCNRVGCVLHVTKGTTHNKNNKGNTGAPTSGHTTQAPGAGRRGARGKTPHAPHPPNTRRKDRSAQLSGLAACVLDVQNPNGNSSTHRGHHSAVPHYSAYRGAVFYDTTPLYMLRHELWVRSLQLESDFSRKWSPPLNFS